MSGMDELVAWLRTQIEGDKAAAEACAGAPWSTDIPGCVHVDARAIADNKHAWGSLGYVATVQHEGDRQHIARHDPRDVIARCDAELAILDEHRITRETVTAAGDFSNDPGCQTCHRTDEGVLAFGYCKTLRLLAQGRQNRPGYREEWRP